MNFYHPIKIGSLNLSGNIFLAPVAGYSDRSFRKVCYDGGANLAYTEMVSSEALTRASTKTYNLLLRADNEKNLAVQIFGGNPETMANSARILLETVKPELIDINAGCPVPKIVKTGAGSALTKNPENLYKIVKAVNEEIVNLGYNIPVTVKIRSGWDFSSLTWKEAAAAAVEAGAKAITLHARTKTQGYEGKADWTILSDLSQIYSDTDILIFGSGDVFSPEDAKNMFEQTKCNGVMFARGAMGNPYIFKQTQQLLQNGSYTPVSLSEKLHAALIELTILSSDIGENLACREMRKRFCAYTKGFEGGSAVRKSVVSASSIEDYQKIVNSLVAKSF